MKTRAIAVKYNGKIGMRIEYDNAEKDVLKTVPRSHNRVVREKSEAEYRQRIEKACYGEAEIEAGKFVYYFHKVNLGTKKWPYIVQSIEYGQIKSVGEACAVMTNGDRPYLENVLAVFTGEE